MVNSWFNSDNLYIKFGPDSATATTAGEYKNYGPLSVIEVKLDLTTLTATAGGTIVADTTFFPKNARIEEIVVEVETAATGATATLDIGLKDTDRSTQIDYDGFVAAMTVATITPAGKKVTLTAGSSFAGALIGTTNATVGYIVANYNTAAFTAGVIKLRIYYYNPT